VPLFRTLMVIAALGTVSPRYLLWLTSGRVRQDQPEFDRPARRTAPAHSVGAAVNTGTPRAHDGVGATTSSTRPLTERGEHDGPRRHPRRDDLRVDRMGAAADRDRRSRRVPAAHVQVMDPGDAARRVFRSEPRPLAVVVGAGLHAPRIDYHALAPEIVLAVGICVVLLVDLFVEERRRWITSTLSGFVLLGAFLPS
jgi:hypothetical protein